MAKTKFDRRKALLLTLITKHSGKSKEIVKEFMRGEKVKRRTVMYFLKKLTHDGEIVHVKRGLYALPGEHVDSKVAPTEKVGTKVEKCRTISIKKSSDLKRVRIYNLACLGYSQPTITKSLKFPQSTVSYHLRKLVAIGALKEVTETDPKEYRKGPNSSTWDELLVVYWEMGLTREPERSERKLSAKIVSAEKGVLASTDASDVQSEPATKKRNDDSEVVVVEWLPNVPVEVQSLMFEMTIREEFTVPADVETWGNNKVGFGFKMDVYLSEYPFETRVYLNQLNEKSGGGWKGWFHLPPFPVSKKNIREGIDRMEMMGAIVGRAVCQALGLSQTVFAEPVKDEKGEWKKNLQIAFSFPQGYFNEKLHGDGWEWWTDDTPTPGTWETNDLSLAEIMGQLPIVVRDNRDGLRAIGSEVSTVKKILHGLERRSCYLDERLDRFGLKLKDVKEEVKTRLSGVEVKQDMLLEQMKEQTDVFKELLAEVKKDREERNVGYKKKPDGGEVGRYIG